MGLMRALFRDGQRANKRFLNYAGNLLYQTEALNREFELLGSLSELVDQLSSEEAKANSILLVAKKDPSLVESNFSSEQISRALINFANARNRKAVTLLFPSYFNKLCRSPISLGDEVMKEYESHFLLEHGLAKNSFDVLGDAYFKLSSSILRKVAYRASERGDAEKAYSCISELIKISLANGKPVGQYARKFVSDLKITDKGTVENPLLIPEIPDNYVQLSPEELSISMAVDVLQEARLYGQAADLCVKAAEQCNHPTVLELRALWLYEIIGNFSSAADVSRKAGWSNYEEFYQHVHNEFSTLGCRK